MYAHLDVSMDSVYQRQQRHCQHGAKHNNVDISPFFIMPDVSHDSVSFPQQVHASVLLQQR